MGRFKNFFKNRFRKKKPVELEEPDYLKTLRENLIRGRGFENPQKPVEASSSSGFSMWLFPFMIALFPDPGRRLPAVFSSSIVGLNKAATSLFFRVAAKPH